MILSDTRNRFWLTRFAFQRALAFIYCAAFLVAAHQYVPLLGSDGIIPCALFIKQVPFAQAPSLFYLIHSDAVLQAAAWSGLALALLALSGLSDARGWFLSTAVWFSLWLLQLSFVNVGYLFYSFGWESMLLEAGFLAIFLGPSRSRPAPVLFWLYRWMLFRVIFGAGLIKLRGDGCWRDLTCMNYHYETQPVPNAISWYLHKLPEGFHQAEVLFTHFVELVIPWLYFAGGIPGMIAGGLTVLFQGTLIVSGNLSWLNYITIVIALACFDDRLFPKILRRFKPAVPPEPGLFRKCVLAGLCTLIGILSIGPAVNLLSPEQKMNASFDPLNLVNAYGAFGGITRVRREVILLGSADGKEWKEYEFKCKPGDVSRAPCLMSPYHYRLDWQIWFAAMNRLEYNPWIVNLAAKLLTNDAKTLSLLAGNPFPDSPPALFRADLYEYRFTTSEERRNTGHWWKREYLGGYMPAVSRNDLRG